MADNIEMKGLGPEQGGGGGGGDVGVTKMAAAAGGPAEGHVHPFLDLPGVVGADGGEPDVEKGQPAATTTAGVEEERNQYDVSPLTVPDTVTTTTTTGAADSTHATAASTVNHKATTKHRLVSRLRSLANNKVFLAATLVIVALLAATIALAVIVSKDSNKLNSLGNNNSKRFDTYLDGFSGVFDHDHSLAKHSIPTVNVHIDSTPSFDNVTTTFAFTTSIVNKTMTVTVPTNSTLMVASATIQAFSVTTTHSCLEWGDGAGPCTRPYGSPNATPLSVLNAMSSVAAADATTSALVVSPSSVLDTETAAALSVAAPSSVIGTTETIGALSVAGAATSSSSDCAAAPATTTIFVTISTTNTVNNPGADEATTTVVETNRVTSTLTETIPWGNTTTTVDTTAVVIASNDSLATLSVPSFTVTLQSTVGANGTAATVTTTGNGTAATPATTDISGVASTTAVVASGGDKAVGKPLLGATGHNNNGGHTGNGLYCVVMLVGIVTALLM